ncbi:hypothetical protein [uncultured Acetobacteroides sp.]|uniref:hypothetical protein n=1 Tax=uncultured Acetobacteroides sp. TaxID=1760811 RepID=UPI0029F4CE1C|nr:hypothetical protein [uncultured Acetobacteroides sp.]
MKNMDKQKVQQAIEALNQAIATLNEQCADDSNTKRTIDKISHLVNDLGFKLKKRGC